MDNIERLNKMIDAYDSAAVMSNDEKTISAFEALNITADDVHAALRVLTQGQQPDDVGKRLRKFLQELERPQ